MTGEECATHRRRALVLALSGGLLLFVAFLGVPGHFNPEACTNYALGREGVAGWRSIDRTSDFWLGYTCELGFEDGSTERIENTARWPLAVASVGMVLTIAAMVAWLHTRRAVMRMDVP